MKLLHTSEPTTCWPRSRNRAPQIPPSPFFGDGLGLAPGPEISRLLELIAEERAAGTISTREDALDLVRRDRST